MYRTTIFFGAFAALAVLVISACTEEAHNTDASNHATHESNDMATEKTTEKTTSVKEKPENPDAPELTTWIFQISGMT